MLNNHAEQSCCDWRERSAGDATQVPGRTNEVAGEPVAGMRTRVPGASQPGSFIRGNRATQTNHLSIDSTRGYIIMTL